jgi:hypothetical protein
LNGEYVFVAHSTHTGFSRRRNVAGATTVVILFLLAFDK